MSAIPTRRVTRTTRTLGKDIENANARPSRISTRAKPPSSNTATGSVPSVVPTTNGGTTRATSATAASKAKAIASATNANGTSATTDLKQESIAAGKRKREALGELATNNKPKSQALKGKEKDDAVKKEKFDGVVLKSKATGTTRQPLRTVAGTRQTSRAATTAVVAKEETIQEEEATEPQHVKSDNAMAVDVPVQPALPSIAVRRSNSTKEPPQQFVNRRSPHHRASRIAQRQQEQDVETARVFKKPRTSSEPPQDAYDEAAQRAAEERALEARIAAEIEAFADEAEADPENSNWEDLDADDADDPLMVSEYVGDIFNYLKEVELTTMPNPNYMETQRELAWKMRGILTDWLIQVHVRFRLLPETLYLCVNIIDRFLSARVVSLAKLQLVGITCMFIAAKFEEIVAPSVSNFLHCADSSYTEAEILQAERYVLKTLDWNLSYPNPVHYLRRVSKADEYNIKVRTLAKYLLEIGCLEWRLLAAPPSLMAAAAIWLARLSLGMENWTPNLAHYSSYAESSIVPTATLMLNYILKPVSHESFFKKYAGKRYLKSSVYMREWALSRWQEGVRVDLAAELPRIKAEIRIMREEEEKRLQLDDENGLNGQGYVEELGSDALFGGGAEDSARLVRETNGHAKERGHGRARRHDA